MPERKPTIQRSRVASITGSAPATDSATETLRDTEPGLTASETPPDPGPALRPWTPPVREHMAQLNVRVPGSMDDRIKALHHRTGEPIVSIVTRGIEVVLAAGENQ